MPQTNQTSGIRAKAALRTARTAAVAAAADRLIEPPAVLFAPMARRQMASANEIGRVALAELAGLREVDLLIAGVGQGLGVALASERTRRPMTTEGCGGGEQGRSPGDGPQTRPPFEKETIRLPDGRLLTFYRFPEEPRAPPPADDPGGPGRTRRKER